jgi:hypothetical protein
MLKKKEGLSDEEFRHNWEKVQAPRFVPLRKKHGATFYSQVRTHFLTLFPLWSILFSQKDEESTADIIQTYPKQDTKHIISQTMFQDKQHTLDYDGIATTIFPSAEAAIAYMQDPEYGKIHDDMPKTVVQADTFLATGGEEVIFLNQNANK